MKPRVVLVHDAVLPVQTYGGTERVIWWLTRGLHEMGVPVTLVAKPGTKCPYAKVVEHAGAFPPPELPAGDIVHYFNTPPTEPKTPYLVSIHGNGKPGEVFLPQTSFVSRNHAERHGAQAFVYNGVDPDEYEFRSQKSDYLLFLAKASWKVKNVDGAIRISRAAGKTLKIVGGSRWWCPRWRGVHWEGMLGGAKKREIIAGSRGLLFPVLWPEPFGLAVVEAMVSGTPVLASAYGSLPELVSEEAGKICDTESDFVAAVPTLGDFKPERCREWALSRFHYRKMAEGYQRYYEKILNGVAINELIPRSLAD